MNTRHIFWPMLIIALLAIAVPAQGLPWGITVLNDPPIVAGSDVTFNVTGEPTEPFHLRVSLDGSSIARLPTLGSFSMPASGAVLVNWTSSPSLASENYTVEVFSDAVNATLRVPETVQAGDYLIAAKLQKEVVGCDTVGDPGWNELFQISWTNIHGSFFFIACQNIADSDDAGTLAGLQGDAVIYAIRGHSLNGSPEFQTAFNDGPSIDPNPPALTPSYPNYLSLVIGTSVTDTSGDLLSFVSPPSGYTNVVTDTTVDNQFLTSSATKEDVTGTEDPTPFDFICNGVCVQTAGWGAATIAIPDGVTFEPRVATTTFSISIISTDDHQELVLQQLQQDIVDLKLAIEKLRAEFALLGLNQSEMNTRLAALELLVDSLEKQVAELERLMGETPDTPPDTGFPMLWFIILVLAFVLSIAGIVLSAVAFQRRD